MKKNILKLLPIALAAFAVSTGYAKDEGLAKDKTYDQGYEATKHDMVAAYNAPARYDLVGEMDFFFQVGFILWQPMEEGLQYAIKDPGAYNHSWGAESAKVENMDFDFKPGIKIGMGLAFNQHDDWMISGEYTWYVARNHATAYAPIGGVLEELWEPITVPSAYEAHAKWRVAYNMLEGDLSRPYYLGTKLILKPYAAIKGGWISQKYRANYYSHDYYITYPEAKQKSWLAGPKLGLGTDWMIGKGFKMFGNIAGALLYQNFETRYTSTNEESETAENFQIRKDSISAITPNAEIGFGFGWGSYYANKGWNLDLRVGYDFQIYWSQNHMHMLMETDSYDAIGACGSLMLNGLSFSARFDF